MSVYQARPLKAAAEHVGAALRHLLLAVHHLEANGFALEVADIVAELEQLAVDIEFVAARGALDDLREAVPPHVIQAAIAYRGEQARRQGRAPFTQNAKRRRAA